MEPAATVQDLTAESLAIAAAPPRALEAPLGDNPRERLLPRMARGFIREGSRWLVRTRVRLTVEGREHVPVSGPVLIASRHFHHQWDAIILVAVLPRCPHFLVALDWVRHRAHRALLEWCCRLLRWPVMLRHDGPRMQGASVYRASDVYPYMRRAGREAVALLGTGACLTVFPEAFPNVDSVPTPKRSDDEVLPFRSGFVRLAAWAERDPRARVPIVPAGFEYRRGRRWQVTLRFGPAIYLDELEPGACAASVLEQRVRVLSGLPWPAREEAAASAPNRQVLG